MHRDRAVSCSIGLDTGRERPPAALRWTLGDATNSVVLVHLVETHVRSAASRCCAGVVVGSYPTTHTSRMLNPIHRNISRDSSPRKSTSMYLVVSLVFCQHAVSTSKHTDPSGVSAATLHPDISKIGNSVTWRLESPTNDISWVLGPATTSATISGSWIDAGDRSVSCCKSEGKDHCQIFECMYTMWSALCR